MTFQQRFALPAFSRGFHLISHHVEEVLSACDITTGVAHLFIQHTSAALTINENADPTVRTDFESHFNQMVPESAPYFIHTYEGPDDMPAHIKASLLGASVSFPIANGQPLLGTWQGIYLCEHRNHGGSRRLVLTVYGQ
ncbi:MAG: secondary thiamine-phosphate synthase enzyme YjbQ [Bacteroidota bacterium]